MIVDALCKSFVKDGTSLTVLDKLSFEAPVHRITVLMGPSGCGKTTLLRLVGNLDVFDSGSIVLDEQEKGPVAYLFQEPRLLPWKTVYSNVEIVLRHQIGSHQERHDRTMHFLELVDLADFATFKPNELSGGMRQRVAIARAFAYPARLMLLDEPFQSLDHSLRFSLLSAFLDIWSREKRTVLFVTHEATEAVLAANRIVLLDQLPARVKTTIDIDSEHNTRKLENPELVAMQSKIYSLVDHQT